MIRHAQRKRIYLNRAFGGDCHPYAVDGSPAAGATAGKKTGKGHRLPVKPETMEYYLGNLHV
jgi:hypothetical protein